MALPYGPAVRIGQAQRGQIFLTLFLLLCIFQKSASAHPQWNRQQYRSISASNAVEFGNTVESDELQFCYNSDISPFDYSVKVKRDANTYVCPATARNLFARDGEEDDYSCSESKPCKNGACCAKETGYCNYGPEACGTDGKSPNDKCWSNCDAHAECGRFAKEPGKKCPLNVCCSQFGFCGMTEEFCKKGKDKDEGCQSGCEQPDSGASGGDVQSRVVGYYESWAHDSECRGMPIDKIPVEGLTHLYFSFGFISPNDFKIIPMENQKESLFSDLTDLKKKNRELKTIVALGGWTFNDNGTEFQPVFSNMVSSASNRAKFISNLMSFLRETAFDGVDFDWEYPGAPDRGGHEEDGPNFTIFLKELKEAFIKDGSHYVASFTIPTSYWYLRWFDLKAVEHVDFVNVMSYDLHGVWDSTNPIGSHVLAHTNMTEIKEALNLLWRNDVSAKKLNLGLGFYGRSFQLADPGCSKPGCNFKAGGSSGSCTKNSGTLSYKEITEIIDQKKLRPVYDKENAVKYIVWDQDQWVSYDDEETFKQKIDFANKLGLGGLLIWAIDLDTPDLKALQAVLAPKKINAFAAKEKDPSFWEDGTAANCYTTDCGGSCKTGFIPITHQPCGGAKPGSRHSKKKDSNFCCPLSSAPDPKKCKWRGTAPSCNGHCHKNEVTMQYNKWGSGKYCEDGRKVYCCEQTADEKNKCYWTGAGDQCKKGDEPLTFAGTFLEAAAETVVDLFPPSLVGLALDELLDETRMDMMKRFCCPPDEMKKWKNCEWHGKPGSCNDNQCPLGRSVQLATNAYGGGETCWPRFERDRVFCCNPSDNKSPFLPVPLDHLFPHPPTGDDVDSDYKLEVDNTWGDGKADTADKEPNSSSFGFVVLTSPEKLQTSLDKRDGSHWELFNCNDAVSEDEQTIQMFCTDVSENSNCHKISSGGFVAGTILEMPPGCGPSKYAVAKSMVPAADQSLPEHLAKRNYGHQPIVYDLTFDFEWHRVRRDLGDTQMRVDFSNEVGYWDNIVAKAAETKRKRSLEDFGGNHKRWLEEEWRDDFHNGALSHEELHKRWFGKDVIDWVKELFNKGIKPEFTHDIDTTFTAILVEEQWGPCKRQGVDIQANLLAQAKTNVKVSTSFGLTIITTLGTPLDLSQSYLYFKNKGEVSATFTLDAVGRAKFETGDKELLGLQNFPGATFGIPKLLTVGPNFKLFGAVEASVTLAGHLESRVEIAKWDVQQTYPDQGADAGPKALSDPNRDGTGDFQGLQQPSFDFSVTANGEITAHLKPTFEFGIVFDKMWQVGDAKVAVVADGWTRLTAAAGVSSQGNCPFTYGIDLGADLYATVEAPKTFGWKPTKFPIAAVKPVAAKQGGTCPQIEKRSLGAVGYVDELPLVGVSPQYLAGIESSNHSIGHRWGKRGEVFGPLLKLPPFCLFCAPAGDEEVACANGIDESDELDDPESVSKRDLSGLLDYHLMEKRADKKISFCSGKLEVISPKYDSSGNIVTKQKSIKTYGYKNPDKCDDYDFGLVGIPTETSKYATEHILEFQLLKIFLEEKNGKDGLNYMDADGDSVDLCDYMKKYWAGDFSLDMDGVKGTPIELLPTVFPGKDNTFVSEFVLLEKYVNGMKERMWSGSQLVDVKSMKTYVNDNAKNNKAFKKMRDIISTWKYHQDQTTKDILKKQSTRVADVLERLDAELVKKVKDQKYTKIGLKDAWNSFMKARTEKARRGLENFLDDWLKYMNDAWTDGDGSSGAKGSGDKSAGDKSAGDKSTGDKSAGDKSSGDKSSDPKTGDQTNSKASRLAKLKQERDSLGTWSSPFA